jgi:hypothetical protein
VSGPNQHKPPDGVLKFCHGPMNPVNLAV